MVVCQESKLEALYGQAQNCPALRTVVKIGSEVSEEERELAEKNGLKLYSMDQVEVETPPSWVSRNVLSINCCL